MAKRKDPFGHIPDDIKAMTLEQLDAEYKATEGKESKAEYERLLKARDEAQEALSAYNQRKFDVLMWRNKLHQEYLEKTEAEA